MTNPWLKALRFTWLVVLVVGAVTIVLHVPVLFRLASTVCRQAPCDEYQLGPDGLQALQAMGISLSAWAAFRVSWLVLIQLALVIPGVLLYLRKSQNRIATLVSISLIALGPFITSGATEDLAQAYPALYLPAVFLRNAASLIFITTLFYLFPSGRFVPRWSRWVVGLLIAYSLVFTIYLGLARPDLEAGVRVSAPPFPGLAFILFGIAAQIFRYRRVSTPIERQQTKWVVFGLMGIGLVAFLSYFRLAFFPPGSGVEAFRFSLIILPIGSFLALSLPISLVLSVLRYRLWDLDTLINRTLVYVVLSAALAAIFLGGVAVLQEFLRRTTGQESQLAVVGSTLAIAALFSPLRGRIQDFIDHRFYRSKYDAEHTMKAFAATAREVTNPDELAQELIEVVDESVRPTRISLWIRRPRSTGASSE